MRAEPEERSQISDYTMDWVTEEVISISNRNESLFCSPEHPDRLQNPTPSYTCI
jgi:hypothetical protein